jgi:uncharacterized membrane protein YbhN (UPF0104 family)
MKSLRFWRVAFWVALPLAAVWVWRRAAGVDILQTLSAFQINLYDLLALVAFNVMALLFFNLRWWLILRALGQRVPYLATLRYRMAGFAISYFTPGMQFGGEPLQVYALHTRHAVPGPQALASVTLDKIFELLANFTFLVVGLGLLLQYPLQFGLQGGRLALWAAGLLLLPLVYLLAVAAGGSPLRGLAGWLGPRLPARLRARAGVQMALAAAGGAEAQIGSLIRRKPLLILQMGLSSALIWALSLAEYWLALRVLGVHLTLPQTMLALTAARLAFLTPLPGGLGALEAGQMLAMSMLGLSPLTGVAISLWIRLRDIALGAIGAACGSSLSKPVHDPVHPLSSTAAE